MAFCYSVFGDRVAETCEARGRGRTCGSLPLLFQGGIIISVSKTFSTFSEQLKTLQNDKHLIITDEKHATDILQHIGYFPLIGGYKHLFRIPLTKRYKEGTSLEEIYTLYLFDTELRELFFKYLLQIERHLRSLISYYFSESYGESQEAYLNKKITITIAETLKPSHVCFQHYIEQSERRITPTLTIIEINITIFLSGY